jgi:hypothetical protein
MRLPSPPPPQGPPAAAPAKLFAAGLVLGPLVDGPHNRALLEYGLAPVRVGLLHAWSFETSWIVPPLLGLAYVVLGRVLPRAVERFLPDAGTQAEPALSSQELRHRAGLAAASAAALVRLSAALESARAAAGIDPFSHPLPDTGAAFFSSQANLLVPFSLALLQWKALDGRASSLASAALASCLGPLCELPLCYLGCWRYLDFRGGLPSFASPRRFARRAGGSFAAGAAARKRRRRRFWASRARASQRHVAVLLCRRDRRHSAGKAV